MAFSKLELEYLAKIVSADLDKEEYVDRARVQAVLDQIKELLQVIGTFEDYPKVYKSTNGTAHFITVIYRDHSETYERISVANEKRLAEQGAHYDPEAEEQMELGNGAERVHCSKETTFIKVERKEGV